jgi:hypothetical protein
MNSLLELLYKIAYVLVDTVLKAINHFDQETDFETPLHLRDSSAIMKGAECVSHGPRACQLQSVPIQL